MRNELSFTVSNPFNEAQALEAIKQKLARQVFTELINGQKPCLKLSVVIETGTDEDFEAARKIAFAYYTASGEFIGFRADTFGTVSKYPKVYRKSEKQIETVRYATQVLVDSLHTDSPKQMAQSIYDGTGNVEGAELIGGTMARTANTLEDAGEFTLRVVEFIGPENDAAFIDEWVKAGMGEVFQTLTFNFIKNEN
jgi:hypothetical protein